MTVQILECDRTIRHRWTIVKCACCGGSLMRDFMHLIEKTNWDEQILQHERILNIITLVITGLACLYFLPICVMTILGMH
jgi:hypothetical protein